MNYDGVLGTKALFLSQNIHFMALNSSAHDPEQVLNNRDQEVFLYVLLVDGSLTTLITIKHILLVQCRLDYADKAHLLSQYVKRMQRLQSSGPSLKI